MSERARRVLVYTVALLASPLPVMPFERGTRAFALSLVPCGLFIEEVRFPLDLFHGEQDTNAPLAMVRRVVASLPSARLVTYEGASHLSTLCNRADDFARALLNDETRSAAARL